MCALSRKQGVSSPGASCFSGQVVPGRRKGGPRDALFEEGEVASDAMCLCDITGSRDTWVHHCEFHLWVTPGQLGSFRGEGEREQPGVTGRVAMPPWPPHSPSFLGLLPLLLAQGTWALQSSSHCDLIGVGVGFFTGTFLRWGWAYFHTVQLCLLYIYVSLTPQFV